MYPLGPRELGLFRDSPSTGNILAPNLHSLKTLGSLSNFPPAKEETKRPNCLQGKCVKVFLWRKGPTLWRVVLISIQRTRLSLGRPGL